MPTTPRGFPYPADTAPVADTAAAIKALAEAVDTPPNEARGMLVATTNASGQIVFPHGLPGEPTTVQITHRAGTTFTVYRVLAASTNATNIGVECRDNNGAVQGNTTVHFYWTARR